MSDIRIKDPSGVWRDASGDHDGSLFTTSNVRVIGPAQVPGIGTAAAYLTGDAFGLSFSFATPRIGTISNVTFLDLDDEGIIKELVLFKSEFTATADNSAFSVSDADLLNCITVIEIVDFFDYGSNRVGIATPAFSYVAPKGRLYGQFVTRGADNIAAGSIPRFIITVVQ